MSVSTHGSQQGSTTLSKDIEMLDPLSSPDAFLNRASINQTILGKIVAAKQEWVAARKLAQGLRQFVGARMAKADEATTPAPGAQNNLPVADAEPRQPQ